MDCAPGEIYYQCCYKSIHNLCLFFSPFDRKFHIIGCSNIWENRLSMLIFTFPNFPENLIMQNISLKILIIIINSSAMNNSRCEGVARFLLITFQIIFAKIPDFRPCLGPISEICRIVNLAIPSGNENLDRDLSFKTRMLPKIAPPIVKKAGAFSAMR